MDYKEKVISLLNSKELSKEQKEKLEDIFPELKEESEGERIKNEIKVILANTDYSRFKLNFTFADMINWLEKQDEHPSDTDNKFIRMRETKPKDISEFLDRLTTVEQEFLWEHIAKIRELDKEEQTPIDNVESKFHEGYWIIFKGLTLYIKEVVNGFYIVITKDGTNYSYGCDIDNTARLWTINDSKDGDFLVCGSDKSPFIFKGLLDKFHPDCPVAYCGICENGEFCISAGDGWWTDEEVLPATKEQSEQLLKKIADEGYEWNPEKKELKRVKDEPENHKRWIGSDTTNSVKDHIGQNPIDDEMKRLLKTEYEKGRADTLAEMKKSWNEEDEKFFNTALWHISYSISNGKSTDFHCDTTEWFKSLKERLQPQSEWKPTDEQMKILNEVLNFAANHESSHWNDYIFGTLNNLIRQLKKLRK